VWSRAGSNAPAPVGRKWDGGEERGARGITTQTFYPIGQNV